MSSDTLQRLSAALADRYRLERELGAGGMATVYLAHDLKHDRDVAIKVLHPDLGAALGGERFLSEIRTTARLQHPHILPLLDSGDADGLLYYVMPYATGETLRARLDRERQLPVHDAVLIAREVADALGAAHAVGIIHRDIKPENILLQGGHALVADFGIALAVQSAGGQRMTQTGLSLGTPQYMSPEQAMGEKQIDARSDIYALGAVTYEMLVGEPPFTGPSVQAIVARLVTEEPRTIGVQRKAVPEHVESAVMQALEKLPADRFASAAEFVAALTGTTTTRATTSRHASRVIERAAPWRAVSVGLGIVACAALAVAIWALGHNAGITAPSVFDAGLPDSAAMFFTGQTPATPYGSALQNLSLASDGSTVVYLAQAGESTLLWRRSLRDATSAPIAGTEGGSMPRISPDGSQVAFLAGPGIMVIPLDGGQARRVVTTDGQVTTLEWISPSRLIATDAEGYRARLLDAQTGEVERHPISRCIDGSWFAQEQQLICGLGLTGSLIDPKTGVASLIRNHGVDGAAPSVLAGSAFHIIDGKYLVYTAPEGDLRGARYDPRTHEIGRSISLVTGVRRESIGTAQFDVDATGMLIYAPGGNAGIGNLVRLGTDGVVTRLPMEAGPYARWDLSRDRRWLAAVTQASGYQELRVFDLRGGQSFVWTRGEVLGQPLWSPDGASLMVTVQDSSGMRLIDSSPFTPTAPTIIAASKLVSAIPYPYDYHSPTLVVARVSTGGRLIEFDPTRRPVRFDTIPGADGGFVMMSPNGKHILFTVSAGSRVIVTASPPGVLQRQVAENSVEPIWLSDTEVLYRSGVTWHLARLDPITGEPAGSTSIWGNDPRFSDTFGWSNRPSWDGGIIYQQGPVGTSAAYLRVIPNWVAHLRSAVDGAKP